MRTNRLRLLPGAAEAQTLQVLGDRCSALWNVANYTCRQAFLGGVGVPGYSQLCTQLRAHEAKMALPSDIAQEVFKKLAEAWKSYFALRQQWKQGEWENKPGLPRYRKHRDGTRPAGWIPVKCARAYTVDARNVAFTLPADLRNGPGHYLSVPYRGVRRYEGQRGRGELVYDGGRCRWYFHYSVDYPDNRLKPWSREAGLDLGVRVAASLSIDGIGTAWHYSGRDMLKDWDYWGRRIARHQSELAHRRRGQRTSRRLRRFYQKRSARFRHAWEAQAARIVSTLKAHQVGCLYIGWPKDIRGGKSYGRKWNGRIHNFWSFNQATRIVEKHCARAGIAVIRSGERGTSSTCPECASANVRRRPRHELSCRDCGFRIHSDQAGSRNLLRLNQPWAQFPKTPGPSRDGAEAAPRPETHRWNRHRWVDASNPLETLERPAA
jgi:transposase